MGESVLEEESRHLRQVHQRIGQALEQAKESVQKSDREYMDTKRYMVEHRGDIDPHEMFQNELLLKQTDRTGAMAVEILERLKKLKDSPYFARIDFCEAGQGEPFSYYIGRFALNHDREPLVFDWRAPVSGMFYDCEVGPAAFQAPDGRIQGELTKKGQVKIRGVKMEYALETSSHIQDDVLQKELSHTSDEKMKSIISTIQKEQNRIIRNENQGTMIIQGVAGSGKTSIALHRIAYLLYRFKNRLSAKNVTILSPNRVFGDYISNVIPELGEEPIYELSFEELAEIQLEGRMGFEPEQDLDQEGDADESRSGDPGESRGKSRSSDPGRGERERFKSTLEFVRLMDAYIEMLPDMVFAPKDYTFGRFRADAKWIGKRFKAYGTFPVKRRLLMVADDIRDRFDTENIMEDELPRQGGILKSLASMLTMKNTLAVYRDFYEKIGKKELFVMADKKTLEWADVYPFLYLHAAFEGLKESGITRHLVIDEMQDYTPVQYAALNRMFPCQKTILGDFGQFIHPNHLHTLEDLLHLYEGAEFVRLNKSYRSTYEIMTFAGHIRAASGLEPVKRHGDVPGLVSCRNEEEELCRIMDLIRDFRSGDNASLGIILKTHREAAELYDLLSEEFEVHLIEPESTRFSSGISVTSVKMAKGLEFDQVIVPHASDRNYRTDHDRSLLYIACTRAMHRLTLTFSGKRTGFID